MRQTERLAKACDPKSLTAGQMMEDAVLTCGPRTDGLAVARRDLLFGYLKALQYWS